MKIWFEYGSEHSANLVIIGTFASRQVAEEAQALLEGLKAIAEEDEQEKRLIPGKPLTKFSDALLKFLGDNNFHAFGYSDPEQLLYEHRLVRDGEKLIITTDEYDVGAFLKIFVDRGAKLEIYSAHDHGGPYGRNTRGAQ